jgi:Flp pilus assembly protein TadG
MVSSISPAESRKAKKHPRKERGQSLIEFALTAPMLIVLLLGLVEMGHAFNSYMTIVAASRDSARMGAQLGVVASNAKPTMLNLVGTETERLENAPIPITSPSQTGSTSTTGTYGTNCGTDNPGVCIEWGFNTQIPGGPLDKWVDVRVCYNHSLIVGIPGLTKDDINMCSHTTIRIANPQS